MRWKALEFLGNLHSSDKVTFDFKSRNYPSNRAGARKF